MSSSARTPFESAAAALHEAEPLRGGCQKRPKPHKRPAPFPVRFSNEERALLESRAGGKPLGRYIRDQLLGEDGQDLRKRSRSRAKPKADYAMLAKILGALGQSDQVKILFLMLAASESKRIALSASERAALSSACASIQDMRQCLISALGLRS